MHKFDAINPGLFAVLDDFDLVLDRHNILSQDDLETAVLMLYAHFMTEAAIKDDLRMEEAIAYSCEAVERMIRRIWEKQENVVKGQKALKKQMKKG